MSQTSLSSSFRASPDAANSDTAAPLNIDNSRQVVVEVDTDDPNDGYMRTRRPHRFMSKDRDPKMFNKGTADARRLAVDQMSRDLVAKAEADRLREEAARREEERRRIEQNRRRIRSLQRQVERGQPLEPGQQAVLGYYTALKNNIDDDDRMAKNVLEMLLSLNLAESEFRQSLDSVLQTRGFPE